MKKEKPTAIKGHYMNRDISWIDFNRRVLAESTREEKYPKGDCLNFFKIAVSNLDEFYSVRVGKISDAGIIRKDSVIDNKTSLTASEILELVSDEAKLFNKELDDYWERLRYNFPDFMEADYKEHAESFNLYFKSNVKRYLTPFILAKKMPFPFIESKRVCVVCKLEKKGKEFLGLVPVPLYNDDGENHYIVRSKADPRYWTTVENVIYHNLKDIFPGYKITDKNILAITRNSDISLDIFEYDNNREYVKSLSKILKKRDRLAAVRLEHKYKLSKFMNSFFTKKITVDKRHVYKVNRPISPKTYSELLDTLRYNSTRDFAPAIPAIPMRYKVDKGTPDLVVTYPTHSMDVLVNMLRDSVDIGCRKIRITLYRVADISKLVDVLCDAADRGVYVEVVIELKARFDEYHNIDISKKFENHGVHVAFTRSDIKVHCKLCIVEFEDYSISYIGTGNFNESTCRFYTDLGLITQSEKICSEVRDIFKYIENPEDSNIISEGYVEGSCLVSMKNMADGIIELIDREIALGEKGFIMMKMNSLTDKRIIDKLIEAAEASVEIKLFVRGACCLLPDQKWNMTITSIIGKYLEHSRIYMFGKQPDIYIGSADMMVRNLYRRVEVLVPVQDKRARTVIESLMNWYKFDTDNAHLLDEYGEWQSLPDQLFDIEERFNVHEAIHKHMDELCNISME